MSDPTDTLRARVEQAQALAAAATPGPWGIMGGHNDYWIQAFDGGRVDGWPTGQKIVQLETWEPATKQGDAKLMAAAPDLVALVTDLWSAYATRAQDASVAVARACLERDEARKERDAALAEVARLRGEAGASASAGRELVWVQDNAPLGSWHLCNPGDLSVLGAPYSAWLSGRADAYQEHGASHSRTVDCAFLRVAVFEAANMARADGRRVPPHPLGWDVGVSDG